MTMGTNVPTPAWNNPTIQPQFFAPSYFPITAIQFGSQTQITVSAVFGHDCNFVVGQQVLFEIPEAYGTFQLDGMTGIVTEIVDSLNFKVNIPTNSQLFSAFIPSPLNVRQIAQVLPAGTFRTGNINSNPQNVGLTIPGSFINTQPYVV